MPNGRRHGSNSGYTGMYKPKQAATAITNPRWPWRPAGQSGSRTKWRRATSRALSPRSIPLLQQYSAKEAVIHAPAA
eukprot:scaffold299613_cov24-Tisochrysis_lutea.AAC.3